MTKKNPAKKKAAVKIPKRWTSARVKKVGGKMYVEITPKCRNPAKKANRKRKVKR